MGGSLPAGYVEVRKGVYERRDVLKRRSAKQLEAGSTTKRKPQTVRAEPPILHEPLAKVEGKEGDSSRLLVLIESVRGRFLDTDSLYGSTKFCIDFLRYCGAIPQDTEKDIELKVTQRKPHKGEAEKTVIEVWDRKP